MKQLQTILQENTPWAIELRRHFHQHPETSTKEVETCRRIRAELEKLGIELLESYRPTAVVAKIRGAHEGPTILLREDIDALPMSEDTDLPFASQNEGCAHACGHDIHTAGLLLTARGLLEYQSQMHGDLLLVFQPAEEIITGAAAMFRAGFGHGETAYDEVIGFHVDPSIERETIGLTKGAGNASADFLRITVRSIGGHGAHPYRCADPVATAAYLITQLQAIISRENPALQPAVLTFCSIHGGSAMNIIPTEVTIEGSLRAFDNDSRKNILESIQRVTTHCCAAMRTTGDVEIFDGIPVLYNTPSICDGIARATEQILGEGHLADVAPTPGSDDFSCFLEERPGVQFRVGTGFDHPDGRHGIHNPRNIFDESAVYVGAAVMAQYVLNQLCP